MLLGMDPPLATLRASFSLRFTFPFKIASPTGGVSCSAADLLVLVCSCSHPLLSSFIGWLLKPSRDIPNPGLQGRHSSLAHHNLTWAAARCKVLIEHSPAVPPPLGLPYGIWSHPNCRAAHVIGISIILSPLFARPKVGPTGGFVTDLLVVVVCSF